MCKYVQAAKRQCTELGMREDDYMLFLSNVFEDEPYCIPSKKDTAPVDQSLRDYAKSEVKEQMYDESNFSSGHLIPLKAPGCLSEIISTYNQQENGLRVESQVSQTADIRRSNNYGHDDLHGGVQASLDFRKNSMGNIKFPDEGYESFMSSTHLQNIPEPQRHSDSVASTTTANNRQTCDCNSHKANVTEQGVGKVDTYLVGKCQVGGKGCQEQNVSLDSAPKKNIRKKEQEGRLCTDPAIGTLGTDEHACMAQFSKPEISNDSNNDFLGVNFGSQPEQDLTKETNQDIPTQNRNETRDKGLSGHGEELVFQGSEVSPEEEAKVYNERSQPNIGMHGQHEDFELINMEVSADDNQVS